MCFFKDINGYEEIKKTIKEMIFYLKKKQKDLLIFGLNYQKAFYFLI